MIRMLVYAAPLLSEEKGFATLSSPWRIAQFFDCINHCAQHRPEHASTVSIVRDILQQARGIYLQQTDAEISIQRVQRFIDTLQAFPPNSPGEQVLIWASFIAASDCLLDEHKAFFERTFQRHHARNGFSNLPRGVDHLHEIWARNPSDKWASLLPHARLFIM